MEIKVMHKVLAANDAWAAENRNLLKEKSLKMLNVIGSPGAGKTALLERTIESANIPPSAVRIRILQAPVGNGRT